jgi:hypothetical protein
MNKDRQAGTLARSEIVVRKWDETIAGTQCRRSD